MKKKSIVFVILVVTVVMIGIFFFRDGVGEDSPHIESAVVNRGEVSRVISVTGHVEPVVRIDLSFLVGGNITSLPYKEGDHVTKGAFIAELNHELEDAALREVDTRITYEQRVLERIVAPLRFEEQALKDATVVNAESTLKRAEELVHATLLRVYTQADDAIHEAADELFNNVQTSVPTVGISFSDGSTTYFLKTNRELELTLNNERARVEQILQNMKTRAYTEMTEPDTALQETRHDLEEILRFLTTLASVVNRYSSENTIEQTVYEAFQTSIASARTAVNGALTEVATTYTTYSSAQSSLALSLRDLAVARAGATPEEIETQEAALAMALSARDTAYAKIHDRTLVTPVEGTVSRINVEVGESVTAFEPVLELITEGVFEIEAFVPEADISSLKLGDVATITFDAFEKKDVFQGEVVRIALTETIKDGVPTYKTIIRIINAEKDGLTLRSGMTADVEIQTEVRTNVLFVPQRSILYKNDQTFLRVVNGLDFEERKVNVGLRGSNGTIEIISGVREGEEVVIYIEES